MYWVMHFTLVAGILKYLASASAVPKTAWV